MAEKLFEAQSNYGWGLSLNMTGKAPAVAKRIWNTYADALAFVNDFNETAIEGIRLSVVNDSDPKKNGVYYVVKAGTYTEVDGVKTAKNDGELKKIGGAETEVVAKYSEAVTLSNNLVVGQLIKITGDETIGEGDAAQTYKAGFYIVVAPGSISALATSSGATDEVGALQTRVAALESDRVKVTDFNTYKSEVTGALDAKAGLDDFNAHNTNANIHVTADDKAKWNNAQANAEATAANALAAAKLELQGYADQAELDAVATANGYTDTVAGAYAAEGVNASGLRKEIAERDANVLSEAKSYADGLAGNYDTKGAADAALGAAKTYTDEEIAKLDADYKAADTTIGERIDGVETAYKAADAALDKKITDMDAAYKAADATLDKKITDMDAAYKAADATLKSELQGYADQAEADAVKAAANALAAAIGVYADGETPASGLRAEIDEKVAAVVADAKTYSIATVTGDELAGLGENVKEAYKLIDEDSVKAGEYIKIYKDSALQKVELNGQELEFTYLLTDGKSEVVKVDVSAFLAESEFGNGLQVIDHVVSVKLAEGSESFLTVDADGVKLTGVQTAIDTAKSGAEETAANALTAAIGVYAEGETPASGLRAEIASAAAEAQSAAEETAKNYTDAEIAKVNDTIVENERVTAEALTDLDTRVNANADAIARAAEDAAQTLENYYNKDEVDATVNALAEAVRTTIEDNERTTAKALIDLDNRVDVLETIDHEAYVAADAVVLDGAKTYADGVASAAQTAAEHYVNVREIEIDKKWAAADLVIDGKAQGYASAAQTAAETYAKTYTDALFTSFQFATNADIDSLFETKTEEA